MSSIDTPGISPLTLGLSDGGLVVPTGIAPDGGLLVQETGNYAVTSAHIGNIELPLASDLGGAYFSYTGTAEEYQTPAGAKVDYKTLHYDLIGYTGKATFGFDPQTGAPTVSGTQNPVVLSSGDLIAGSLQQQANGGFAGSISTTQDVAGVPIGEARFTVQSDAPIQLANGDLQFAGGTASVSFMPGHFS